MSYRDFCLSPTPDCPQNQVGIGDFCYNVSTSPGNNCVKFVKGIAPGTKSDPYKILYDNSLLDCMQSCNQDGNCQQIKIKYKNVSGNLGDETGENGDCELYSIDGSKKVKANNGTYEECNDAYTKQNSGGDQTCLNIMNSTNGKQDKDLKVLNINFKSSTQASKVPRVESKFQGGACRNLIQKRDDLNPNNQDDINLINAMANWCKNNPASTSCKTFCNDPSYQSSCETKNPQVIIITAAIFAVFLFIFIVVVAKHKQNKKVWIPAVVVMVIITGVCAYFIFKHKSTTGDWSGTQPEASWNPYWNPNLCGQNQGKCTNQNVCCADLLGDCENVKPVVAPVCIQNMDFHDVVDWIDIGSKLTQEQQHPTGCFEACNQGEKKYSLATFQASPWTPGITNCYCANQNGDKTTCSNSYSLGKVAVTNDPDLLRKTECKEMNKNACQLPSPWPPVNQCDCSSPGSVANDYCRKGNATCIGMNCHCDPGSCNCTEPSEGTCYIDENHCNKGYSCDCGTYCTGSCK